MISIHNLVEATESYLRESVAPLATEIDSNPNALQKALKGLGKLGILALLVPQQWGGPEFNLPSFDYFQELMARYSGALAFLQIQHQTAAAMLLQSQNSSLMQEYLPKMSYGQALLGVGFSQLRRKGKPTIVAVPVSGGYQLEGQVPWITGWGFFPEFIVAAALPDEQVILGIVPLIETNNHSGAIHLSQPLELCAMASTNTVIATINRWFLPAERVVSIQPRNWIHLNDNKNVHRLTYLALGCALAGVDLLATAAQKKGLPFIERAKESLEGELTQCRATVQATQKDPEVEISVQVELRAWAIDLAVRCAHAAIAAFSGAANYGYHAAQRVYREALVWTVSAQTEAVMAATLERLSSSRNFTHPLLNNSTLLGGNNA